MIQAGRPRTERVAAAEGLSSCRLSAARSQTCFAAPQSFGSQTYEDRLVVDIIIIFLSAWTLDGEQARGADARALGVGLSTPDSGVIVPSASDWHRGELGLRAQRVHVLVNTLFVPVKAFVLLFT